MKYKTIIKCVLFFAILIFIQFSLVFLIYKVFNSLDPQIITFISIDLSFFILIVFYFLFYKKNPFESIKVPTITMLISCVLIACIVAIVYPFLNFEYFIDKLYSQNFSFDLDFNSFDLLKISSEQPYYYLRILLIGPIYEEIFYRKIILDNLKKDYSFIFAILISSALFAIGHLDLSFFSTAFFIGLLLGYLYHKTNNLLIPILLHILINLLNLLLF